MRADLKLQHINSHCAGSGKYGLQWEWGYIHNHDFGNDFTGRHRHPKLQNSKIWSLVYDISYN